MNEMATLETNKKIKGRDILMKQSVSKKQAKSLVKLSKKTKIIKEAK
ncbi:hypothetical protein P8881_19590 [Bacillus haynesii]|nr:hypothetical protein [Bacillus haynesii]MCY8737540.1 hypothetical protein [Bacillus haynesii]MEC0709730.1 hypothetical protein [Bacillus haynesii]MEC0736891.1 hypothetical protein [Bacillus haynesii]